VTNENCLRGFECPECGHTDKFYIECTVVMAVYDDGANETTSDVEWNDTSYCRCALCDHFSTVREFVEKEEKDELAEYDNFEECDGDDVWCEEGTHSVIGEADDDEQLPTYVLTSDGVSFKPGKIITERWDLPPSLTVSKCLTIRPEARTYLCEHDIDIPPQAEVYVWREHGSSRRLDSGDIYDSMERRVFLAGTKGEFYFVDLEPHANWAHPCLYVFVEEDHDGNKDNRS